MCSYVVSLREVSMSGQRRGVHIVGCPALHNGQTSPALVPVHLHSKEISQVPLLFNLTSVWEGLPWSTIFCDLSVVLFPHYLPVATRPATPRMKIILHPWLSLETIYWGIWCPPEADTGKCSIDRSPTTLLWSTKAKSSTPALV